MQDATTNKDTGMTMPLRGAPPPIDDEALSAYLDGALDAAEAATVADAVRRDPALASRARETEATVALLRALPQPAPRRTFVLTPEMAAPFRPPRVARRAWLIRLVPAMTAASAVAAVLLLVLFVGDLRTGGFRTGDTRNSVNTTARAVTEVASDAASAAATRPPAAAAAAAATSAPAATSLPAAAARPAGSAAFPAPTFAAGSAPAAAGAATLPTTAAAAGVAPGTGAQVPFSPTATAVIATSAATSAPTTVAAITLPATVPPAAATTVADVRATAASAIAPPPSPGGATVQVPAEERRVPLALVRAGEITLILLFLVALGFAVAGIESRRRA